MSKKNLYAFLISFILLLAVIVLNRLSFNEVRNYSKEVDHARQVITVLGSISNHFKSAQIYTPSYKNILQKDYYDLYFQETSEIRNELVALKMLINDEHGQQAIVDSIELMITQEIDTLLLNNISELLQKDQGWRLYRFFTIHQLINKAISIEEGLLVDREKKLTASTRTNNNLTTAFGVVGVGILIYTFISIFFLSKKSRWLEGFLETVLNTSQNGIAYYKPVWENDILVDFKLDFANNATGRFYEKDPGQMIGSHLSDLKSKGSAMLMDQFMEVAGTGRNLEFEYLNDQSTPKWFLVSLAKMEDGVTASFQDISEIKKYEGELKEKIIELERSNVELEQYAYAASHDLQEPLRKIRAFGSYLQDSQAEKLDEKGRQQLQKIMDAAERMSVLINDILGFSSIRKEADFGKTNLNEILDGVLQDLDLVITQKQAIIRKENLPVVEAIPLQMTQLFYNLLNNSLKFVKEGRIPLIEINCRPANENELPDVLDSNLSYVEIMVKDNGIGFRQDYVDQIFGLFKRLNDKQYYPGSGIGLALCKKVVDNHHGFIRAVGIEDQGATFLIYLPLKQ